MGRSTLMEIKNAGGVVTKVTIRGGRGETKLIPSKNQGKREAKKHKTKKATRNKQGE